MDQIRKFVERNSTLALVISLYGIGALAKSMELGSTERFMLQGAVFVFFLYLQMSKAGGNTELVGKAAPNLGDRKYQLSLFQGKVPSPGKPYVLEVWATWCPPCVKAIPHMSEVAKKYKGRVDVLSVSSEGHDVIKQFIDDRKAELSFDYPTARCAQPLLNDLDITSFPSAFVVDAAGDIAWVGHPMRVEQGIEKVLAAGAKDDGGRDDDEEEDEGKAAKDARAGAAAAAIARSEKKTKETTVGDNGKGEDVNDLD